MLQSKIAAAPVTEQQNNSAIDESKCIDQSDNHSEWYQIEIGAERANFTTCGNIDSCHTSVSNV